MQSESRSCKAVHRLLDSYISNELLVETNIEILDHLEACSACTAALDSKVQARAALRLAVQRETAPDGLLQAIRNGLPGHSQPAIRERWAMAAVILVGLFLGGIGIWHLKLQKNSASGDVQQILELGLAAYEQCPAEAGIDSLGWEYDGLVEAIGAEKPLNYGIAGAHRCMFDGRLFVTVVLKQEDARVSFIVTEKDNEQLADRGQRPSIEASGVPVYSSRSAGYQIAGFETGRHLAFVISKSEGDANLRLASSIAALYAPSVRSTQKEARNGH